MKPTIINIISFLLGNSEQTPSMTKLIPAAINIVVSSVLIGFSIPLHYLNLNLTSNCSPLVLSTKSLYFSRCNKIAKKNDKAFRSQSSESL